MDLSASIASLTWCVVPMFNEKTVIGEVIKELKLIFPNVICIDDGSSDDSSEQAREAGALVIELPINIGQGGALRTGFSFVSSIPHAKYIVTFDADGQHDPKDAAALVHHLDEKKLDIVFATRFSTENKSNVPWIKRLLLRSVTRFNSLTRDSKLTDSHNGLRALTVEAAKTFKLTQNGMAHASELVSLVMSKNLRYGELPVTIRYTTYSKAKGQSLWNGVNIFVDLILR